MRKYVRETKTISLETAIHKMTQMPAQRLGLRDRGVLKVGSHADLVVFDPSTVADVATFENPLQFPTGIPYVFVNGDAAKWDDAPTNALAGMVLRK